MNDTDIAYIAGLFDGEGSINIRRAFEKKKKHKKNGYRMSNATISHGNLHRNSHRVRHSISILFVIFLFLKCTSYINTPLTIKKPCYIGNIGVIHCSLALST